MNKTPSSPKNSYPKTTSHAEQSIASHAPSKPYRYVLIALIALSAASCRSVTTTQTHQSQQSHSEQHDQKQDSSTTVLTQVQEIHQQTTRPLPPDTVSLNLSLDTILRLPEGAIYTATHRHTHLQLGITHQDGHPRLQVQAHTDSIPQTLHTVTIRSQSQTHTTATHQQANQATTHQDTTTHTTDTLRKLLTAISLALAIGTFLFIAYIYILERYNTRKQQ